MTKVMLAFDYGSRRIGVATLGGEYSSPTALKTLQNTDNLDNEIKEIIKSYKPKKIIVGLPRNLDGEETGQSKLCREFAGRLEKHKVPIVLYDETLSTERASSRLGPLKPIARRNLLDSMAAQIILEDYIRHAA
jgi:putative Holliday junction resolvase